MRKRVNGRKRDVGEEKFCLKWKQKTKIDSNHQVDEFFERTQNLKWHLPSKGVFVAKRQNKIFRFNIMKYHIETHVEGAKMSDKNCKTKYLIFSVKESLRVN